MSFLPPIKLSKLFKIVVLLFPVLEILVFILVGKLIGAIPTVLLAIASTLLGFYIIRTQRRFVKSCSTASSNAAISLNLSRIVVRMMAGIFLIIPGFITDILGFLFLIPVLCNRGLKWLEKYNHPSGKTDTILEGEYWHTHDQTASPHIKEKK